MHVKVESWPVPRRYRLKARADRQASNRQRIVEAATDGQRLDDEKAALLMTGTVQRVAR